MDCKDSNYFCWWWEGLDGSFEVLGFWVSDLGEKFRHWVDNFVMLLGIIARHKRWVEGFVGLESC